MRRSSAARETCPSCGRESLTTSGQCLFCLEPVAGGREVQAAQILRLSEFDRARSQMRRSRGRKAARSAGASLVGILVGALLVALFWLGMQWLMTFFGKGTSWRQ